MSPKSFETLKEAVAFVEGEQRKGTSSELIVLSLIKLFGAKRTLAPSGNTLRCATVSTSCTWSRDRGLVDGWLRLAQRAVRREAGQ